MLNIRKMLLSACAAALVCGGFLQADVLVADPVRGFSTELGGKGFEVGGMYSVDGGHKLVTSNYGFHAVFHDRISVGNFRLLYAFSADGVNWSYRELDNVQQNSHDNYHISDPSIAYYNNNLYISYYKNSTPPNPQRQVHLRILDANPAVSGTGTDHVLETTTGGVFRYTDVYVNSTGVYVAATYTSSTISHNVRVFKCAFDGTVQETKIFGYSYPEASLLPVFYPKSGNDFYLAYGLYGRQDTHATNPTSSIVVYNGLSSSINIKDGYRIEYVNLISSGNGFLAAYVKQPSEGSLEDRLVYRVYHSFSEGDYTEIDTKVTASEIYTTQLGLTTANVPVIQYVFHDGQNYKIGQIHLKSPTEWSAPTKSITTAGSEGAGSASVYAHMLPNVDNDRPYMLWYDYQNKKVWFNNAPDKIAPWQPLTPKITWVTSNVNTTGNQVVTLSLTAAPLHSSEMYYEIFRVSASGTRTGIASGNWLVNASALNVTLNNIISAAGQKAAVSADNQRLVLRAMSRDEVGNESVWSDYTLTINIPDRTPPNIASLTIPADYARYVSKNAVQLSLSASDQHSALTTMNIGNTSPPGSAYAYAASRGWTLTAGDGLKTVYTRYYDAIGNYTDVSATINVDTTPPAMTTTSRIQSGAQSAPAQVTWAAAEDVLSGNVRSGVRGYYVYWGSDPAGVVSTGLQTAASTSNLAAMSAPGVNYLRVQTVDNVGNKSGWQTVLTYSYTAGVTGSIVINDTTPPGPAYTNTPTVSLTFIYSDPKIERMRFQNDNDIWAGVLGSLSPSVANWRLSAGDGEKRVYVEYSNISKTATGSAYDLIYLDTLSPNMTDTGRLTTTTNQQVIAQGGYTLTALDSLNQGYASGLDEYYVYWGKSISGEASYYQANTNYANASGQLLALDGAGTYYLRARPKDKAGNIGPWATVLTYQYDPVPPTGSAALASTYTNSTQVNVVLTASDNDKVEKYYIANSYVDINQQLDSVWKTWNGNGNYGHTLSAGSSGERQVYVWFKDRAGNISVEEYTATVNYINPSGKSGSILIKGSQGDDRYTTTANVRLELSYDNTAVGMLIWNEGVSSANSQWQVVSNNLTNHLLLSGDGTKTVRVAYRDSAGTIWEASDSIELDTAAPYDGRVLINNDAQYTNTRNVLLTITAAGNPYEMQIINNESGSAPNWASAAWVSYNQYSPWVLSGTGQEVNVTKTVQARFRDEAGNISVYWGDSIILNTSALNGSLLINPGQPPYTNTRNVMLTPISPSADWMLLSNRADFSDKWDAGNSDWQWIPYESKVDPWDLFAPNDALAEGVRYVYAVFKNQAGTLSPTVNAAVIVDMTPPYGPGPGSPSGPNPHNPGDPALSHGCEVVINDGDENAIMNIVRLRLNAIDAQQMLISNYADFRDVNDNYWRPYADTVAEWPLLAGSGQRTVWVKFRDIAGNISLASDSIVLNMNAGYYFHFIEPDGIDDVASDNFTISWEAEYLGDDQANVRLYYVGVTSDGTNIGLVSGDIKDIITGGAARDIPLNDPTRGVIWDTRDLDSGYYYIYAVVSGSSGSFEEKALHPIYIRHEKGVIPPDPGDPDPPSIPTMEGQAVTSNPPSILIIEPWTNYNVPPITKLPIWWHEAHKPGDGALISLYYSSSPSLSGVLGVITENIPASAVATSDKRQLDGDWTVPDLPQGTYYIIGVIKTPDFTNWDASTGRVIVNKDDTTAGNGGTGEGIWTYPNPFAPQSRGEIAVIAYRVKKDQWTRVYVYNIRGEKIWHIDSYAYAGQDNTVRWDGRLPKGNYAGNGIYVLFLTDEKRKVLEKGRLTLLD
ncbi:hypothetical protein NO1_0036 [Candidatus Termititenax aidoneus]|uniref:Uncharacterized protein n=1 Tax=Termititenax aidoneus TaxID=2218524 RepID=A0A388T828_TERA1|nr:hypothetical protein NO1_0036 [Candidatus Termititenax aidoneus]